MTSFFKRLFDRPSPSVADPSPSQPVPQPTSEFVTRVPDDEVDGVEAWIRWTTEPDVRGIEVIRISAQGPWQWQVLVGAMEFVRREPLESRLRTAIGSALRSVEGAVQVEEEDTEKWIVDGDPSGEALAVAVAAALDELAPETRAYLLALRTQANRKLP